MGFYIKNGEYVLKLFFENDSDYPKSPLPILELIDGRYTEKRANVDEFLQPLEVNILLDFLGEYYKSLYSYAKLKDISEYVVRVDVTIKSTSILQSILDDKRLRYVYHVGYPASELEESRF